MTEAEYWGIVLGMLAIGIGLLAIIIAIVVPLIVERLRRPHLIVGLSPNALPNAPLRFLHCNVVNNPHSHLRWIERNPAYEASARITFRHNNRIICGPVVTKWTSAPECVTPVLQIVNNQLPPNPQLVNTVEVFDSTKTVFAHTRTLPSDNLGQEFDILVKHDGEDECYAITGWSYRFQGLRDPGLSIPIGDFAVEIEVIASNSRSNIRNYRLRNAGPNIGNIELTEN